MGNETTLMTLGDVCYITDGAHAKVERQVSGVMYLTSKNISDGKLKLDSFDHISESCFSKLFTNTKKAQRKLQVGDVLMGIIGTLGNCYLYKETDYFGISSSIAILRPEQSKLLPEYLYYYISSVSFKSILEKFKGGSVQGYTNIATIKALPIPIPSIEIQKEIVANLTPLDNKITLNRQINQTLEQMAQALFKSWFVDFDPVIDNALDVGFFEQDLEFSDELLRRAEARKAVREIADFKPLPEDIRQLFPAAFEESSEASLGLGGWVPEGWDVKRLDEILELAYGKALKKSERINGDYPVYGSGGIDGTHISSLVDGPGIVVGRKGTVGSIYWESKNFHPIDTVFYVKPKAGFTLFYCYELLKTLGLEEMNTDAAVPGLNRNNAYRLLCVAPSNTVLEELSKVLGSYRHRIELCDRENMTLTNLRDTLLPKLISGELRLSDSEVDTADEVLA
ncbi:restriction endonuclease subunit S [Citrobacter sp. R56]|uniref:restriction endonuclease subunit S n=1 Tax=Citrobacter sp. R56 TaxID=1573676 RepID=UPI00193BAC72|nr:restriction endonuclease subunit S [Citrobacter sp. R56]QRG78656.1 restriction endonuclease subunit S [Citrobacter sp. R56]